MSGKVTVKQAAEQLGKSEQFVRVGLQRGILPIGYAFIGSGKRWTYYINEADLKKYIEGGKDSKIYNPRLTVEHAACLMGKSVKFIQQGLQQKVRNWKSCCIQPTRLDLVALSHTALIHKSRARF